MVRALPTKVPERCKSKWSRPRLDAGVAMNRVLLVVEDEIDVGELFRRFLRREFSQVHVARNAAEAEKVLGSNAVTHVVSDYFLAPTEPSGPTLLACWRKRWPSIRFAAVFTGQPHALGELSGIDAVFRKPLGFEPLLDRLGSER